MEVRHWQLLKPATEHSGTRKWGSSGEVDFCTYTNNSNLFFRSQFHMSGIHGHVLAAWKLCGAKREEFNSLSRIFCQTGQRLVLKQTGNNKGEETTNPALREVSWITHTLNRFPGFLPENIFNTQQNQNQIHSLSLFSILLFQLFSVSQLEHPELNHLDNYRKAITAGWPKHN